MSHSLNSNRLKAEKSLYLRQHQDNPIHWWSFGIEAIEYAQKENKPIFLSIGYSSCHWCHVMGHEAFLDLEVATFLNENFISIKVDREEFPDIDNYYQKAAQLFGSNGGWPLSAFLLPDTKPFFVGTYYPVKSKNNGPTFLDLIKELKRAYDNEKDQVLKNAQQVEDAIKKGNIPEGEVKFDGHFPPPNSILEAVKEFRDLKWGGYAKAPKFPMYAYYEWAIEQILEGMVSQEHADFIIMSAEKMLMGGINDHARGGMHRYSTDEKWLVPHFEKMLYDQAGFLSMATKLSLVYPSPLIFDSIINTLDYLENEMLSDDNEGKRHFFSAQDADSEGVEGLYFTFSETEFEDLLNRHDDDNETLAKNAENIKRWFQITSEGNFEHKLNVISLNPELKNEFYLQENWDIIRLVKKAIMSERRERLPPATDNKGVASWNFMLISSLVDLVQYGQVDVIKKMASNLINNVLEGVFKTFLQVDDKNRMKLLHTTTVNFSQAYLEDFVFFAESQLRLYEISSNAVFKQNFKDSMTFITQEFLTDNQMKTRAFHTLSAYPNQDYTFFDASFKSPVATYIKISRRAAALFADPAYLDTIESLRVHMAQGILKVNPISAGESLRALTYPNEVLRVIKMPRSWIQNEEFLNFIQFFLPRFIFDYHDDNNENYEICTLKACEVRGSGLSEFIKTLTPDTK